MSSLNGSQSVDRALLLLAMIGRHAGRGVSLSVLVEESGLNKPTVRRLLLALIRASLVEQDEETRRYYLGEEAYVLGTLASQRFGLLELCLDSLAALSRKTQDTSFLSVRRGTSAVCVYREEGTYPVRTHALQVGFEHPLGVGAGSLAFLAALPDAEVEEVLAANEAILLSRYAALPPDHIRRDVAETRANGYSLNPGLIVANSWGIGVAIRHPDGRPPERCRSPRSTAACSREGRRNSQATSSRKPRRWRKSWPACLPPGRARTTGQQRDHRRGGT